MGAILAQRIEVFAPGIGERSFGVASG